MAERGRTPDGVKVLTPPNLLKTKVGDGPDRLSKAEAERLDGLIAAERPTYFEILDDEINELRILSARVDESGRIPREILERVYFICHRIRGEAGMNGFDLVGAIAHLMCQGIERPDCADGAPAKLVGLHVDAMRAAHGVGPDADSGDVGRRIIEGLKKSRARFMC